MAQHRLLVVLLLVSLTFATAKRRMPSLPRFRLLPSNIYVSVFFKIIIIII